LVLKSHKRAATPAPAGTSPDSSRTKLRSRPGRPPPRRRTDGSATLVTGASGSGKTSWTLRQIPAGAPVLVWDPTGEWCDSLHLIPAHDFRRLGELVIADLRGELTQSLRLGYVGPLSPEHFETFCKLAWVWIRSRRGNVLVVDELADVTSPGKAPAAWGQIVRKNRFRGGRVFALTQRPAESDKTILGNAALLHSGRQNTKRDRAYVAECLDVPVEEVAALQDLQYIERDFRDHTVRRGVVSIT
jgi:hypothetical protein